MDQRSNEWFEARLGKATASGFGNIMAINKSGTESAMRKNYRAKLVTERLTNVVEETYTNQAMQWGIDTEPVARLEYMMMTGNEVEETGFHTHDTLEAGASPDGLIGKHGLLEIKCPNTATHIETLKTQRIPYQYYWQVVGQMWITGREYVDFMSYDPRLPQNAQSVIIGLDRDEEQIKKLETSVIEFLKEVDEEVNFIRSYNG